MELSSISVQFGVYKHHNSTGSTSLKSHLRKTTHTQVSSATAFVDALANAFARAFAMAFANAFAEAFAMAFARAFAMVFAAASANTSANAFVKSFAKAYKDSHGKQPHCAMARISAGGGGTGDVWRIVW